MAGEVELPGVGVTGGTEPLMTETMPLTMHSARWKRLQPLQNMRRHRLSCSRACCVGTRVPVLLKEKMLPMFSPLHFIAYNSGKWSNLNVQWQLFFFTVFLLVTHYLKGCQCELARAA